MKLVKILMILGLVYVGVVIAFESLLGYFQPQNASTQIMTTTDTEGNRHERVLARLEVNGQLYAAVNHWPRAWYYRVLKNPEVTITFANQQTQYTAVPVLGSEQAQVNHARPLGMGFRILTGFPPRYFVRLDPAQL